MHRGEDDLLIGLLAAGREPKLLEDWCPAWHERANCRGVDVDLFFPERGDTSPERVAAIRAVCEGCEVRDECLESAMSAPKHPVGWWGGLAPRELERLRRDRRRRAA